jgi:solute carrier family 35 protein E3
MMDSSKNLKIFWNLSLNFFSSVAIVQINKLIYTKFNFPNMTLTCLNFVATFIGLLIYSKMGYFQIVKVPILKMFPMAFTFCGFVVLTNYSLQFNSVGTYQCLKALNTPCVIFISWLIYGQQYSDRIKLTVVSSFKKIKKYLIK